jgi:integrase/recombinase XerC
MPLTDHSSVQSFFDYLRFEKRYSVHTITSYRNDLTEWLQFTHEEYGDIPLTEISYHYIRSWLASLKDAGLSDRTINRKISTLRSFYKYCMKTGLVDSSPMVKITPPKVGKRLPVFVREEDTAALLETLNSTAEDWKSLNAAVLISVFYGTGMRLSELIQLKEKQVDFKKQQIKVLGKGNKERIIPVGPELLQIIRDYTGLKAKKFENQPGSGDEKEGVLLVTEKGKKLYPKYAWLLVNDYLGRVATLEKRSPHVLRHSFATHLMTHGANLNAVKELLGHSSLAATQVYTHTTIERLRDVHKKAHPKA